LVEDVKRRGTDVTVPRRRNKRILDDERPSPDVHKSRAGTQERQPAGIDQAARGLRQGKRQDDVVGFGEQIVELVDASDRSEVSVLASRTTHHVYDHASCAK
jgi:hypothetical protein